MWYIVRSVFFKCVVVVVFWHFTRCDGQTQPGNHTRHIIDANRTSWEMPGGDYLDPGERGAGAAAEAAALEQHRFTMPSTTIKIIRRTTPKRVDFPQRCNYLVFYCLKAYNTGRLCARTLYFAYHTFKTYCLMDFINCMERSEIWQVSYMGECRERDHLSDYEFYFYEDDYFLDHQYPIDPIAI